MSELQVTQCPFCKTHFRLTQEQLQAAAGNVRCGACLKVFNALPAGQSQSAAEAAAMRLAGLDAMPLCDFSLWDVPEEGTEETQTAASSFAGGIGGAARAMVTRVDGTHERRQIW